MEQNTGDGGAEYRILRDGGAEYFRMVEQNTEGWWSRIL